MTQPNAYAGRPATPAPGTDARELRVARLHPHARRLFWSALVVIAAAGAVGYFTGNLPAPFENWMLWTAAGLVVLLLAVVPYLRWLSRTYTITTRRVIAQSGIFGRRRAELLHARGYTIRERRGPLQRMWGSGTLTLTNGIDEPLRIADIPSVRLVHEALADQVEVNQILAHRDATWDVRPAPAPPGPPPPLP
ncbi:MAG: hypothetical protein DI566_07680 [Microbacterium sp.]|nr:MAG: hypothetical protein DI566_07680 [Microbacterium sp.]